MPRPVGRPRKDEPKRPVGRPRKYYSQDIKRIIHVIQNAPFNQVNCVDWTELLGRLAIFQKETNRKSMANAIYVLLESALNTYDKEKEKLNG